MYQLRCKDKKPDLFQSVFWQQQLLFEDYTDDLLLPSGFSSRVRHLFHLHNQNIIVNQQGLVGPIL